MQADRTIATAIESLGELSQFISFGVVGKEKSESKLVLRTSTPQQISSLMEILHKHLSWMDEDGIIKQNEEYTNCLRGCSLNAK